MTNRNEIAENTDAIIPLSPKTDLSDDEDYQKYSKQLSLALKNDSIFNIALTGIYGSGKSSILATFKKENQNSNGFKFVDISLSTFYKESLDNSVNEPTELTSDEIQLIERSILQQLIYSVPQDNIPLSRFKRITEKDKKGIFEIVGLLLIFIWSTIFVLDKSEFIENIVEFHAWHIYGCFIFLIFSTIIMLFKLISYGINIREIKFKLHDAEFNITNEENKSILNDHLDEVLYFFTATKSNVVIIEDLDRFNNTEIFIRLRELNYLINKSCNHQVRFIYAIRDDMFQDSQRSKFFEYIIPIIPIVNPTNAYDLIQSNPLYKEITKHLDSKFLRNICLYFDDMRLLCNILTEYKTYAEHLDFENLDANKLFAMMVYKNYFPTEFAKLNSLDGEIYELFNTKKDEILTLKKINLHQEISTLEEEIESIEEVRLNSIDDLHQIYALRILNYIINKIDILRNSRFIFKVKETQFKFDELKNYIDELYENNTFTVMYTDYNYNRRQEFQFNEIINQSDYNKDKNKIIRKNNGYINDLNNQINTLKKEIKKIDGLLLQDVITYNDFSNTNDLLWFCIKNGYIDETYQDYISYFFESEHSISRDDKNYARIVTSQKNPDFNIKLTKIATLLENNISFKELQFSSALNFSLLDYLLMENKFSKHKDVVLDTLANDKEYQRKFINEYFARGNHLDTFIKDIASININCLSVLETNSDNIEKLIKNIHPVLSQLKQSESLQAKIYSFFDTKKDTIPFLLKCLDDMNIGNKNIYLQDLLDIIKPEWDCIECDKTKQKELNLFNWLAEKEYLDKSKNMVAKILYYNSKNNSQQQISKKLSDKPFTTILKSDISYLKIQLYNAELFSKLLVNNHHEDESVIIKLVNSKYLMSSLKEQLIKYSKTIISDISVIKDAKNIEILFNENKLKANWSNILCAFSENKQKADWAEAFGDYDENKGLFNFLINFINRNYKDLVNSKDEHRYNTISNSELQKALETALIQCNELSNDAYEAIIPDLYYGWKNISINHLDEEKILSLVSHKKLAFTTTNWDNIQNLDNIKLRKQFLKTYFLNIIDEEKSELPITLETQDFAVLLEKSSYKKQQQNFATNYCENLISQSETIRNHIISLFNDIQMPNNLSSEIEQYADNTQKINYLTKQASFLQINHIDNILRTMTEPYNQLALIQNDDIKFDKTDLNLMFLEALKSKGMIIKIKDKKYYLTRRNKKI